MLFLKAFRRSLENKGGIPTIIFLSDEKFAGRALPDRLLFKITFLEILYQNYVKITLCIN